jgi:uncharacterized protein
MIFNPKKLVILFCTILFSLFLTTQAQNLFSMNNPESTLAQSQTNIQMSDRQKRNQEALKGVKEFFAALEALDIPRFLNVWAENGVQEMPYAPGVFPKKLVGKSAIDKQYSPLPSAFNSMRFTMRRVVATEEPGVVLAEYDGSIGLKSGGRYDNRYVGVSSFNSQGKLIQLTEYFDPFILIDGFPGAREAAFPQK